MSIFHLTPAQLRQAAQIKERIQELESEFLKLSGSVASRTLTLAKASGKKMSASAKARISAAAKARWAKVKAAKK